MKRLTIMETQNGVLVINGEGRGFVEDLPDRCWSFNSLDKAIAHVRSVLRGWRETEAAKAKGGDDGS